VLIALLLSARAAGAQKADTVWLGNGDRVVGEVKSLARALLKYSTDDLGTLSIEWDKVARISTRTVLEAQLRSGPRLYGRLRSGPRGATLVGADTIALSEIVRLTPIERRLTGRISGYLDLGYSYQKANNSTQLTTGARVVYRDARGQTSVEARGFHEDREDAEATARLSAAFAERIFLPRRWSVGALLGYERDEELDLSGRARLVAFGGRTFAESNHIELSGSVGVVLTSERYFSTDTTTRGLEGAAGAVFRAFRYDRPKLDASLSSELFPSFTVPGRVRAQNDVRVSYELVKDFMLTVTLFDSFDSEPQSEGAAKHDFGTTLAISWKF
jgi:hypothetical protein